MTAPPGGYVQIAGLNVPIDVAPTLMAAIRIIYADQVAGLDDVGAVVAVTKAVMADLLDRYAIWQGAAALQTTVVPLQQAVSDAQSQQQAQTVLDRQFAQASAARIVAAPPT